MTPNVAKIAQALAVLEGKERDFFETPVFDLSYGPDHAYYMDSIAQSQARWNRAAELIAEAFS